MTRYCNFPNMQGPAYLIINHVGLTLTDNVITKTKFDIIQVHSKMLELKHVRFHFNLHSAHVFIYKGSTIMNTNEMTHYTS